KSRLLAVAPLGGAKAGDCPGRRRRSVGRRVLGPVMTDKSIGLHNLTLRYDRHPAVHHLDGEIAQGALRAVCGPNGAGKSTLLKALTGVLKPMGGSIDF